MSDVKVYFDLACPYCYLAWGFWKEMRKDHPVEMDWVPWEAQPELPPEGRVKRGDGEEALKKLLALSGGVQQFGPPNRVWPNTHNALLGLEFARSKGKVENYIERVYRAYFVEGADISKLSEVVRLGGEIGLNEAELEKSVSAKEYEQVLVDLDKEAEAMELKVVPSFVQKGKLVLEGSVTMNFDEFKEKYLAVWG